MSALCSALTACVLAVSSWILPQPQLSRGWLVVYGGQQLVQANANWHGYDLAPTHHCGMASISPAHLGQIAWVSIDRRLWMGPCLVVDVGGRNHALHQIYESHEVAEIDRTTARILGFAHGARGYVWFGQCPPDGYVTAERYVPPLALDYPPYSGTPSFWPYPRQQMPGVC